MVMSKLNDNTEKECNAMQCHVHHKLAVQQSSMQVAAAVEQKECGAGV